MKAVLLGIAGTVLTKDEAALFRAVPPAGVILFGRNVVDPAQLNLLTASLRRALPREAVIMVDQEGGRVARLRPPHWRAHPPGAAIGDLFRRDVATGLRAAWITGALIGFDCAEAGVDVAAAPVLDLRFPGAHDVIGDRAYGEDPGEVARLGRAMAAGLLAAGVQPVGKHAPGHGRARVDSHLSLPVVDANGLEADLLPFARNADLPWMMTAHILYPAYDAANPATFSRAVIDGIIRRRAGFDGVLVSDDLAMQALSGAPAERAYRALAAGCDIALYCPGDGAGNAAVLAAVGELAENAAMRLAAAKALAMDRKIGLDPPALERERSSLGL